MPQSGRSGQAHSWVRRFSGDRGTGLTARADVLDSGREDVTVRWEAQMQIQIWTLFNSVRVEIDDKDR